MFLPHGLPRTSQAGRVFEYHAQALPRRSDLLDAGKAGLSPLRRRYVEDLGTQTNQESRLPRCCAACRSLVTNLRASELKPGQRLPPQIPHPLRQSTNARAYLLAPRRTREEMIGCATRLSVVSKNWIPVSTAPPALTL